MLSTKTKTALAAFLVSAVATTVTGCTAETEPVGATDQNVGRVIQPIIRGVTSGTEHDSVVVLTTFQDGTRQSLCTATMVAPNLLVTARHCVSNVVGATACAQDGSAISGGNIQGNRLANTLVVFVGKNGIAPDTTVEANGSARGKKIIVEAATTVCNRDLAFVLLDADVAAPVSPIRMAPPAATEKIAAVGWGVNETGNLPAQREVRTDVPLVGVGPAPYPNNPAWGYGDHEFMVGESACAGDSGSPAFASTGAIVGVAARSGNGKASDGNYATTCMGADAHSVYTHLGQSSKLVNAAFDASGHKPWLEGTPDPYAVVTQSSSSGATGATGDATGTPSGGTPIVKRDSANDPDPLGTGDAPPVTVPEAAADNGGGCSMSGEPQHDNVAYAGGVVALLALVLGMRRRFRKGGNDEPPPPRDPYESML